MVWYITITDIFEHVQLHGQYGTGDNSRRIWGPTSKYPEVIQYQIKPKYAPKAIVKNPNLEVWSLKGIYSTTATPQLAHYWWFITMISRAQRG